MDYFNSYFQLVIRINNASVGLVLTDLNMPVMDGLQLAWMIRSKAKYNHIPILVITTEDTKEIIIKAGKIGVDGYIIKPFNVKQIIEKIETTINHRAQLNAGSPPQVEEENDA